MKHKLFLVFMLSCCAIYAANGDEGWDEGISLLRYIAALILNLGGLVGCSITGFKMIVKSNMGMMILTNFVLSFMALMLGIILIT